MVIRRNRSGYKVYKTASGRTKSVHKRVAEKKVGGKIWKGYEVHHKNRNKSDNRPSNIRVVKKSTHKKIHKKKKTSWW